MRLKPQVHRNSRAFLAVIALMTLLLTGCSHPSNTGHLAQDELSVILSGFADSYSLIRFNTMQADVEFLFEEYHYGQLVHSERLGQVQINAANSNQAFVVATVVSDLENGREYVSLLYSSGGTTQNKRISRPLPVGSSAAYKGMREELSGKISGEYILSVSSYSSAPTTTGVIADKLTHLERYENLHIIRMRVL